MEDDQAEEAITTIAAPQRGPSDREITVAAKAGGRPRVETRYARQSLTARRAHAGANIAACHQEGDRGARGRKYEEVMYEGYGPGGTAILIEGSTDKPTGRRQIRHALSRGHGNLGPPTRSRGCSTARASS